MEGKRANDRCTSALPSDGMGYWSFPYCSSTISGDPGMSAVLKAMAWRSEPAATFHGTGPRLVLLHLSLITAVDLTFQYVGPRSPRSFIWQAQFRWPRSSRERG